jgi:ribosome-associated protein
MENKTFKLKEGEAFIELIKLLKILGIAQTGGHGKLMIEDGDILVNGEKEFRKRKKLRTGDSICALGEVEIEIV